MWIFTTDAFFSINKDSFSPDHLIVRARLPGDIQKHFPHAEIQEYAGTDYRYRASIHRSVVADAIREEILEIDYGDFHGSAEKHRKPCLSTVFDTLQKTQLWQELLESNKH